MLIISGNGFIDEKFYNNIGYLRAKDCDNDKTKFKNILEQELMEKVELITEIKEGYYRIKKSNKDSYEYYEFGEYCYIPCEKGRGSTLYYYAGYRRVE